MAPKKAAAQEEAAPVEESEDEPEEPEIVKKCLRSGGQLYYGDCKVGYKERKGRFIRHGFGRQVNSAVSPQGPGPNGSPSFETVVLSIYEGNWEEDMPCGHGNYKWSDGSSYEGNVAEGQMHGHGKFVWPDGSVYEGAWHQGLLHGQGRFESRFDGGRYMQGRFFRNCFQKQDGRYVDVLQHLRNNELKQVLEGNPLAEAAEAASATMSMSVLKKKGSWAKWSDGGSGISVVRCFSGKRDEGTRGGLKSLSDAVAKVLSENATPLILASASHGSSAVKAFVDSGCAQDPLSQLVSIRLAAVEKRRQRDWKCLFRMALQSSLLGGCAFALVFEDDEDAASLKDDVLAVRRDSNHSWMQKLQASWINRQPSLEGIPTLPEGWRLSSFFDDSAMPAELLCPVIFNARGKSRRFLPDQVAAVTAPVEVPMAPTEGTEEPATLAEGDGESADGAFDAAAAEAEQAAAASRELAKKAAAQMPPGTVCGPSGHTFELSPEEAEGADDSAVLGMPLTHQLRPVLIATARIPDGLDDAQVRKFVKERFSRHMPVHRLAVLVLDNED
mmetsp:Transcript_16754/g.29349  ORF Transcript_16754/g.29349 Transcript_16754/m.29349 type:complete len:557 (+) Transcript_16754:53-1723(+)|eukprot:CAMPEP_0197648946 /NCGR_PEP_ID=MMETSP1338-20131121/28050_1 /TAXON_ID=43686 ORGANISM="Pelagodinium beii, Strain RCC1491" /NCGR_SAMPLE_ID=MMETSP1338 /ASSEMBLY_ACC=CAM_ASM_000754 /LENGTH=556 /DNA_ID=CAMNT_0043223015 /DNA_START=34 /DNA_END=1704 /DNA_ORIENTATION=+